MSVIINGTGGGGTPAAPDGSVQYNNSGAFGGFGIYTPASHTLQLDAADSATPNNQSVQTQSVLAGTSDVNGATLNFLGSQSTGVGFAGTINYSTGFQGLETGLPLVSISNGSPGVFTTATDHNLGVGQSILLQTSGTLPAPLATLTTYYINLNPGNTVFAVANTISDAVNNNPINTTTNGSGSHSYVPGGVITVGTRAPFPGTEFICVGGAHPLVGGMQVQFQSTGSLGNLSPNTNYFVVYGPSLFGDAFQVATTLALAQGEFFNAITAVGVTGTLTYQVQGGTTQNPASPVVSWGPSANAGVDVTPAETVTQTWNTAQGGGPLGAFRFVVVNLQYAIQGTSVISARVVGPGGPTLFAFNLFAPSGATAWQMGAGSAVFMTSFIRFTNTNTVIGTDTALQIQNATDPIDNIGTAPVTITNAYVVAPTDKYIIANGGGSITVTLPNAANQTGRELWLKTIANQTVISASSNVVPIGSSTAGTAILAGTAGAAALLVSDGSNWITMMVH